MATQYYDRGQPITLSTYNQLCAEEPSIWNWTGRKLEYFLSSDGTTRLTPGEMATFDGDRSYISAMWSMETSPDPVKVYLIGDSGSVSVTVTEYNRNYPLGSMISPDDPYLCSYVVSNVQNQSETLSSVYIKRQPENEYGENYHTGNGGTFIKLIIDKDSTTTITSVYFGNSYIDPTNSYVAEDVFPKRLDTGINDFLPVNDGRTFHPTHCNWEFSNIKYTTITNIVKNQRDYGLSVYFTSQGILNYMPNTDTVNPFLRT